jgi:hypothetical protein
MNFITILVLLCALAQNTLLMDPASTRLFSFFVYTLSFQGKGGQKDKPLKVGNYQTS